MFLLFGQLDMTLVERLLLDGTNMLLFFGFSKIQCQERKRYSYNIMAKAEDCLLLSVDDRTNEVPRTQRG